MFFSLPSWAVALLVFAVVGGSAALGLLIGRYLREHSQALREPFGILQAAVLGIVGLILAFGLSLAVGRYEDRRAATVVEANAIGTAYLRAELVNEPERTRSLALMRQYADLAIRVTYEVPGSSSMARTTRAEGQIQRRLWRLGGTSLAQTPVANAPRLYIESLNDTFDAQSARLSALNNRVPGAVLALEVICGGVALALLSLHISVLGRGILGPLAAAALVTMLLLITFDLDRPTRGLIKVPATPLISARASMALPPAARP
jgi:hypothetical protein